MGSDRRGRLADDPLRGWLRNLVDATDGIACRPGPLSIVGAVVALAVEELGVELDLERDLAPDRHAGTGEGSGPAVGEQTLRSLVASVGPPPAGWSNPWLPGLVHEQVVTSATRKSRGAWYTPRPLVEGLIEFVHRVADAPTFAVDPTCGGGAFLLAVLDHRVGTGTAPEQAISGVAGTDVDPDAVTVCRWALRLWAAAQALDPSAFDPDVSLADTLIEPAPARWPRRRLIVGNPPFASPLKRGAVPPPAQMYRQANSDDLGQYADLAALHLHRCLDQADDGSVVALVLPQSVVSSRDTAPFRRRLQSSSTVAGMWAAREAVFEAGVRTCAPVITVGGSRSDLVSLAAGPRVVDVGSTSTGQWSSYAARCLGGPELPITVSEAVSTLNGLCQATAGFRDEYYGLVKACREWDQDGAAGRSEPPNKLVTVGSIDPLTTTWGRSPIRFGGRSWGAPVIDTGALDDKVGRWLTRQARPKVVVATQSKVLEPVIDPDGRLVPSTPLLAVHTEASDLALVTAVLLAPPVVAWAWERWFGAALAVDALKLAARQIGELPLPADRRSWCRAAGRIAERVESGRLLDPDEARSLSVEVAADMNRAYRADETVLAWWLSRSGLQSIGGPMSPSVSWSRESSSAHRL